MYFLFFSLYKMKRPIVGPFFGRFYFYVQTLQTMSQDTGCQISEYLDCQFMRRRFFKIHQILPLFAPCWAPIGASPLIFTKLNPHSPKLLPTKFGSNQFSGFGEEVV